MTALTIGSLFSGYGGLDMGAAAALGPSRLAWVCEIDPAPARILARRHPDVPNLGDITAVKWHTVPRVHVMTGGFPCQDLSLAGGRAGLREGTRSGLWSHMAAAIDALRPELVLIENVRGLLSASAHSDMEPCPWCVGDDDGEPVLRALGAVLGDLADLGYDAAWHGLRAADIGAPHGRFRVFVAAWPAGHAPNVDGTRGGRPDEPTSQDPYRGTGAAPQDADGAARGERRVAAPGEAQGGWSRADARRRGGTPAADADRDALRVESVGVRRGSGSAEPGQPREFGNAPADPDRAGREGREPAAGRDMPARGSAADADGGGLGSDLADVRAGEPDARRGAAGYATGGGDTDQQVGCDTPRLPIGAVTGAVHGDRPGRASEGVRDVGRTSPVVAWGPYAAAVARWEHTLGRVAPAPTETSPRGGQRLSPRFVEWMMGLPEGWVTDVGLTRNEQLKALGNGVVPQQAAAAVAHLLAIRAASTEVAA